jgi:hypothetical protein
MNEGRVPGAAAELGYPLQHAPRRLDELGFLIEPGQVAAAWD